MHGQRPCRGVGGGRAINQEQRRASLTLSESSGGDDESGSALCWRGVTLFQRDKDSSRILMRKQISARLQENETCSSRKAECSSQASSSAARPVSRPLGIFLYALLSRRPCRLLASLSVDSAVRVRVIISRCGNSSHWSQIVSERRDCPALFQSCAKESRATPTIICAPLIHDAYRSHARTFRAPVCAVARPGDSSEGC